MERVERAFEEYTTSWGYGMFLLAILVDYFKIIIDLKKLSSKHYTANYYQILGYIILVFKQLSIYVK